MSNQAIYKIITDKIVDHMQKNLNPANAERWLKSPIEAPHNCKSNLNYKGVNFLLLLMETFFSGYNTNRWLTFLQVQELKGKVKRGQKATPIIFYKPLHTDKNGNKIKEEVFNEMPAEQRKQITTNYVINYYHVFNVAQIENLPAELYEIKNFKTYTDFEKIEIAETILQIHDVNISFGGNNAFYLPQTDEIVLPERTRFKTGDSFYSVAFHELAHWTGHQSRLDRIKINGSKEDYAREELVAELTSAFVCCTLGFETELTTNAAYLKNWIAKLKEDEKAIFRAAADAQKAADYLLMPYFEQQNNFQTV